MDLEDETSGRFANLPPPAPAISLRNKAFEMSRPKRNRRLGCRSWGGEAANPAPRTAGGITGAILHRGRRSGRLFSTAFARDHSEGQEFLALLD